ncbi:MAG: hypothetical protein GY782_08310 [Gammaproteobacteria bacterium]|nr:hypothetical protein [Gammaproteobacteria bacterium]
MSYSESKNNRGTSNKILPVMIDAIVKNVTKDNLIKMRDDFEAVQSGKSAEAKEKKVAVKKIVRSQKKI